jgi:hypothetical protein
VRGAGPGARGRDLEAALLEQALEGAVDVVERDAEPAGEPPGVEPRARRRERAQQHARVLVEQRRRGGVRRQAEARAEPGRRARRHAPAAVEHPDERAVVGAERAGEGADGIARVARASARELVADGLPEVHAPDATAPCSPRQPARGTKWCEPLYGLRSHRRCAPASRPRHSVATHASEAP